MSDFDHFKPRLMMATKAFAGPSNISSGDPDYAYIEREEGEFYIGSWLTGFGFVDVKFPKATTRAMTAEEMEYINGRHLVLGSQYLGQIKVEDFDGRE